MGAWDHTPFGNDSAHDWLDAALEGDRDEVVDAAFRAALSASYLDVDEGSAAVAAAALLAAALDGDRSALPDEVEELDDWSPRAELRELAVAALTRVLGPGSELASLWGEGGGDGTWRGAVEALRARLGAKSAS